MADAQRNSVLRRKAEAGRTSVVAARQITPSKALRSSFVQTMDKRLGLVAAATACTAQQGTLAELLEMLPEGGLFSVLEAAGEAQGLMVFDPALLSGVLEQLMVGRLYPRPPAPRRPTRTDAALTADLVDALLRRFEAPFVGRPEWKWLGGFGYATYLDEPRPLGLMLEDIDYRILTLSAEIGEGKRTCQLMVALPAGGGGLGAPAPSERATEGVEAAEHQDGGAHTWGDALEDRLLPAKTGVTAVLYRMNLSIATIHSLEAGMELNVPGSALNDTTLVGVDGSTLARGRLGQSRGKRAVRLAGAPTLDSPPPAPPAPPAPSLDPPMTTATPPMPNGSPVPDLAATLPDSEAFDPPPMPDLPALDDLPEPEPAALPALDDLPDPSDMGFPSLDDLPKL